MESLHPRSRASCDVQAFEILFFALAVARRKSMLFSAPPARQNESGFSVFGEIGERVGLVHFPWAFQLNHACGVVTERKGDVSSVIL